MKMEKKNYSFELGCIKKHITIGPMSPEPVHFIFSLPTAFPESSSIFFYDLEVNSSGKQHLLFTLRQ